MANDTSVDTSTSEDVIFDNNGIYIPQNWQDTLEQFTVFSPERMNHIEQGIKQNSEKIKENWDSISQIPPVFSVKGYGGSSDANNAKESGYYYCMGTSNLPGSAPYGTLIVIAYQSNYLMQLFVCRDGKHYTRALNNNVWSGWF